MATLSSLITEYLNFVFQLDPIAATRLGVHHNDHLLGELSPHAFAEEAAKRRSFLRCLQQLDRRSLTPDEQMDLQVVQIDLETALRRLADQAIWTCAPYWYVEQLGSAFSDLMSHTAASAEERGANLLARLQATPAYLQSAQQNLTEATPPLHATMGMTATKGLQQFLESAIPGFAAALPASLQHDLAEAVRTGQSALTNFESFLQRLATRAQGHFACGADHFDFLLRHFHLLDFDHQSLYEFGLAQMVADKAALERYADVLDATVSWVEQIERVKDQHPQGADFRAIYYAEMVRARAHCVAQDLITLPTGEACDVAWLPDYLRASAPLGLMFTTPPFADGLRSELRLTALDQEAPVERQRQHERDNCYAFARSITLHEIYPGHHTQMAHHKLATVNSPMRRYFSSPLFVEGWGLYTEDLMAETGFMTEPAVQLFKLRNALWRSARVVVDCGLHTRGMSFDEAVDLLCREVRLDRRMAEGEVRRYTTHDNPTYPSAYLLGKTAIHELRRQWWPQQGAHATLKTFHDMLLSYGSPPVKLVAERMLTR
ncbi:MAG: DUF885 domain-containing protein [Caldilinea sp. CFX5]|nr:DUF885 domain-containing protein [Caldilinea sp. CFX5]